ncbi:hypothetical protein [Brachyspira sp. SAP_772]|nr:hypothetical protein [Brachyspira sp. SAP_772]
MTGSWVIDYFLYGCVILIAVPLAAFLYKTVNDKNNSKGDKK